jgi:hypothetical protein
MDNRPAWFVASALAAVAVSACSASEQSLGDYGAGSAGPGGAAGAAAGAAGAGTAGQGGSTINTDGGSAGSSITPDSACLTETYVAQTKPAFLMFQLDVSGSMNCPPTDGLCATGNPGPGTRWEVFKGKLKDALGALPTTSGAGLMHYPTGKGTFSGNPTGCIPQSPDVPLADLATSKSAIFAKLDAIVPEGGTPTHDAVLVALKQLEQASVPGNKFLVLATDGQATFCTPCDISCDSTAMAADNDKLVTEVAAASAKGIRTFVLGAPGSGPYRAILSKMASAGQTQASAGCANSGPAYCHYDMTTAPDFGAALQAALAAISGAALSCVYDIPAADAGTFEKGKVNVQLTSGGSTEQIKRDPSQQDGWDYTPDGTQIVLYGAACDKAKAAISGKIDILYGCPTILK